MSSISLVAMSSSISLANPKMGSFILQDDDVVAEVAYDAHTVLMLHVMIFLICTATGNSDNGVYSMIVMVLFNY